MEVYYNGTWGTVCSNGWDVYDAQVVCTQLGFGPVLATRASYGVDSDIVWLDNVNCTGIERSIGDCLHSEWGIENCRDSKYAGVKCARSKSIFSILYVRLNASLLFLQVN